MSRTLFRIVKYGQPLTRTHVAILAEIPFAARGKLGLVPNNY
jgi:hypothetical protein